MKYFSMFSGVEGFGQGIDGEPIGFSELEPNLTGNSNTLTGVEKDNYVFVPKIEKTPKGIKRSWKRETNEANAYSQDLTDLWIFLKAKAI